MGNETSSFHYNILLVKVKYDTFIFFLMKKVFVIACVVFSLVFPIHLKANSSTSSYEGNVYYVDQSHPLANDSNPGTENLP